MAPSFSILPHRNLTLTIVLPDSTRSYPLTWGLFFIWERKGRIVCIAVGPALYHPKWISSPSGNTSGGVSESWPGQTSRTKHSLTVVEAGVIQELFRPLYYFRTRAKQGIYTLLAPHTMAWPLWNAHKVKSQRQMACGRDRARVQRREGNRWWERPDKGNKWFEKYKEGTSGKEGLREAFCSTSQWWCSTPCPCSSPCSCHSVGPQDQP